MSKLKWSIVAVVMLLALNVALLVLLSRGGQHGPGRGEGPKMLVIDRLHLDADQVVAYEALIAEHQKAIRQKDQEMMAARDRLYRTLSGPDTAASDPLFDTIAAIESNIEKIHYAHFAEIRSICHADQLVHFDALVLDLAKLFNRDRRPPKHE